MNYKNRKWQHEYDYCHHTLYGCGLPHGWIPLGGDGGIRTHKHIIIFVQYKTAMAPSIWYTRWKPMQHPPLFIVYTLIGQRSSAAKSVNQSFIQQGAEKGRMGREENRLVWRLKEKTCQCLLFFDFLWDRWGDLDLERDFLADFLGVLERDLLDRLGVRGEGDLMGQIWHSDYV